MWRICKETWKQPSDGIWRNRVCIKDLKELDDVVSPAGFLDIDYLGIILLFNLAMFILRLTHLVQFSVDTP